MQLTRLTTEVSPGLPRRQKPVDIGHRLHPQGMPEVADFPLPVDLGLKLHPPELQPITRACPPPEQPDIAGALNPTGQPPPAPFPLDQTDFQAALNPPELQPTSIRRILPSSQGLLAENLSGTLTHLLD